MQNHLHHHSLSGRRTVAKIFVIAGNSSQAIKWMKGNNQKRWDNGNTSATLSDYVIVENPTIMRGYRNPHGVFIGTWKQRPDIIDIVTALTMATDDENYYLQKIWEQIYPKAAI